MAGQFSKKCGTEFQHNHWNLQNEEAILDRRHIKAHSLDILDRVYSDKHYRYLNTIKASFCKGCIQHVEQTCTDCGRKRAPKESVQQVDACCGTDNDLTCDEIDVNIAGMSSSAREKIAFSLGTHEAQAISDDINCISSYYRDLYHLLSLNADVYLRKRNKVVLSFLDGISSNKNNQNSLHKCLAVEHVYQLTCSNLVTPYSFVLNLMQYQASQSKLCINLNSKVHPCGAYKTVNNWLTNHGSIPLPFPKDDCIVAFDNDQIIGKSWYIKADNKVNASIVTSFCAVEFDSRLQFDPKFHPKVWFKYSDFKEKLIEIRNREGDIYSSVYDLHYVTVQTQLNDVIQNVYTEQKSSYQNGVFSDYIDKSALEMSHKDSITCVKCSIEYKKSKIKCDKCHANIRENNKRAKQEESTSIRNENTKKKIKITEKEFQFQKKTHGDSHVSHETGANFQFRVLDPAALNPNSYDSVKLVLRKVGVEAGVERYIDSTQDKENCRKWVFVLCDGLPYTLAHKLIHETYFCVKCHESVIGHEAFKVHNVKKHASESVKVVFEFDWVVLLIGKGHFEMNMVKSFFELNWEPLLKNLAELMGFKSERALQTAKLCRDNHKTWQLLRIFYFGTLQELLVPYVRECIQHGTVPSAVGYISWSKRCLNPNYLYTHEQILTYCQAILNYRNGLRTKCHDLILTGKEIFSVLFFGRPHPKYQYISITESCDYFLYPEEIKQLLESNCAFDFSGTGRKGEDLDFKLEVVNKQSKSWISGVPNFDTWLKIFRNLDKLNSLKNTFLTMTGVAIEHLEASFETDKTNNYLTNEIKLWRTHLRKYEYLLSPKIDSKLTTVTGDILDQGLLKFTDTAVANRKMFYDSIIASGNLSS